MKRIVLAFLVTWAGGLGAENPWTMDAVIREVLDHNLTLQAEGVKTGIKVRERDLAFNRLFPSVTLGAAYSYTNETYPVLAGVSPVPVASGVYVTPDHHNLGLNFNAQWTWSLGVLWGIRQAGLDYEASRLTLGQWEGRLIRDTKKIFYQLLVFQENLSLSQRQLKNAEERYRQAKLNFQGGQTSELAVLQAQVAWENRKPGVEELKLAYENLLFSLETLMGRDPDPKMVIQGSLDFNPGTEVNPEEAVQKALELRWDLQILHSQQRSLSGQLDLWDSLLFPSLTFGWTWDPVLNNPWGTADWDQAKWRQRSGALAVQLAWKLDSFLPGSAWNLQKLNLLDQEKLLALQEAQARLGAKNEILSLVHKVFQVRDSLKTLEQTRNAAKRAFDLTDSAYKSGARSLLEVQDAELQYQGAEMALLHGRLQGFAAQLDLEFALGNPGGTNHGK